MANKARPNDQYVGANNNALIENDFKSSSGGINQLQKQQQMS